MTLADLLRLLAVPAFGWIALRDYRTRRVPSRVWYPIVALGVLALVAGATLASTTPGGFALRVALSVGLVVPLAYVFYRGGAFGAADAKAMATLAVVFPTYPSYEVAGTTLPIVASNIGVFSLTVITDGVLVGVAYPLAVAARNALAGRFSPAMFVALPVDRSALLSTHGKLMATNEGFTASGLDLDGLRMYLRWRGLALADLCANPEAFRRPSTLPREPRPPTDGAVDPGVDPEPGGAPAAGFEVESSEDPWGAAAFLDSIDGSAYGTDPETLRAGLDYVADNEMVWVSPGLPFLVPLFIGLLVALTAGDVLFAIMRAVGFV